jgi:predicted RNase H-like HicB family nuclease
MKEVSYFAAFEEQPEGGYTVTFPDVPGAISEGEDFAEAWRNAREALELILEARVEAGESLPHASPFAKFLAMQKRRGVQMQLVAAAAPTKAVRINVTLDEGLLERLNRRVEDSGQSRSAFIADAVRKSLREDVA